MRHPRSNACNDCRRCRWGHGTVGILVEVEAIRTTAVLRVITRAEHVTLSGRSRSATGLYSVATPTFRGIFRASQVVTSVAAGRSAALDRVARNSDREGERPAACVVADQEE